MKILFMSLIYRKDEEERLIQESKCGLQGAVNAFQWALIEGMDNNLEEPVHLLNSLPIGSFPKYDTKLILKSHNWSHTAGAKDKDIGFINLLGLKQWIRKNKFAKEIIKFIEQNRNENVYIVTYDLYTPYLEALKKAKKIYPNIKTCAIVTDLPHQFGIKKNDKGIVRLLRKFDDNKRVELVNDMDSFVLLTDEMKYPLNINDKPYIVMEGIYSEAMGHPNGYKVDRNGGKILLYTGTLNREFGLGKLLEAFTRIDKQDYQLWLCGDGDMKEEVLELCKKDLRIRYLGFKPRTEIIDLQRRATMLINPRTNEGIYTKYSFPSKTMEYLASGTPVIAYKLDGIPDEYDEFIYYVPANDIVSLGDRIVEIGEKSELERMEFGNKAREFIIHNKSNVYQANRVLDLLRRI